MKYNIVEFKNYGFLISKFSEEQLIPIKTEINNLEKSMDSHDDKKHNNHLAGNIKREYTLTDCKRYTENLIIPLLQEYDREFAYLENFDTLNKPVPIILDGLWVNFQKKYEFNPIHKHDGLFSFALWLNVPYNMEDEHEVSPGKYSNYNSAGMFSMLYNDTMGGIKAYDIPVDKTMENSIVIFPSKFYHCVYPFFSSDGYRISVSGNFKLKTG